jgi:hypothetical protein
MALQGGKTFVILTAFLMMQGHEIQMFTMTSVMSNLHHLYSWTMQSLATG